MRDTPGISTAKLMAFHGTVDGVCYFTFLALLDSISTPAKIMAFHGTYAYMSVPDLIGGPPFRTLAHVIMIIARYYGYALYFSPRLGF